MIVPITILVGYHFLLPFPCECGGCVCMVCMVCMCVYACLHVWGTCVYKYIWRPEVDIQNHPLVFYLIRWGKVSQASLGLTGTLLLLASQLAIGISCFFFQRFGITDKQPCILGMGWGGGSSDPNCSPHASFSTLTIGLSCSPYQYLKFF